jgi:hypothetical protein
MRGRHVKEIQHLGRPAQLDGALKRRLPIHPESLKRYSPASTVSGPPYCYRADIRRALDTVTI